MQNAEKGSQCQESIPGNGWRAGCLETCMSGSVGGSQKPDLVTGEGAGSPPNTTYMWTQEWWRVWSMAANQDTTLVLQALQMALARRCPEAELLHHSDRGSTSTSASDLELVQQNGMGSSMSRTANCYDTAVSRVPFSQLQRRMR